MNKSELIPPQKKGSKSETHKSVTMATNDAAHALFLKTEQRLWDVNSWDKLTGAMPSYFYLTDPYGKLKKDIPSLGDFIRIGLPAPDSIEGEGFDWVRIEKIDREEKENCNIAFMRVRPSPNPLKNNDQTAHFFSNEATSTFIIEQNNNAVTASHYGRNERPNIKDAKRFFDKVRHVMVAIGGIMGFSKIQWKLFIENIIDKDDKK